MFKIGLIALGGSLGALARYSVTFLTSKYEASIFPFATLFVNLLGCFFAGLLMALIKQRLTVHFQLFWVTGFLGSFTTFSAFGYETYALFQQQAFGLALLNIILNLGLGLILVALGYSLGLAKFS